MEKFKVNYAHPEKEQPDYDTEILIIVFKG